MSRQKREEVSTYWRCSGLHSEVNCMQAAYHNNRYRNRDAWCDQCKANFPRDPEEVKREVYEKFGMTYDG